MTKTTNKIQIPDRLYFRIGDVADLLGVKPYVLRYWESEFPMINPQKSSSGQRVYRKSDVEAVLLIKHLLYEEKYSIEGAKRRIKELRKEGELKDFKEESLASSKDEVFPARSKVSSSTQFIESCSVEKTVGLVPECHLQQNQDEIKKLVHDLNSLLMSDISNLFIY